MASRIELQNLLENILGSRNVYYQPPASVSIKYPAIIYSRSDIDTRFADNSPYSLQHAYMLTYIDRNPDSEYVNKIASLPMCVYDRQYKSDNLYHDVFKLYF